MFEGLVADLLNKYIGKYVSNLDSKNLNISIFKGDVELKDLQLRPEALAELNLPVEVKAGHVGQLKIDIPWTSLFSADIHVSVENVYILTGPVTDRKYDAERERQLLMAAKQQMLESLEQSALEGVVSTASEDPTLVEKLSANLLHRIQLSVRHIHVRYEDTITNGDHAFACGLMLKQLVVCTTDAHWKPQGSEDITGTMMHKMIKMDELSMYWNPYVPEQHLLKTRLNTDGWKNLLRISIDSHTIFEEELDFIMEPAAAQARLILNSDNSLTLPKLFMDFTIEEVEILLSRQQFLNLINLSESFKMMRIQQRYRKFRPDESLKLNPSSWWHYAYTSIVEEQIRPYSWSRIKAHRAKYKQYVHVYKQYLENPDNETAKATLKTLEEDLDVTNILIAREQAKLQFAREAPDRARREVKKNSGWFSWFYGEEEEEVVVEVDSKQNGDWLSTLTNEERQKLFAVIGYDESSKNQQYPRKYVAYKVQVILKKCCVSMVNYSKKILQASVTHLLTTFEFRPANDAFRISMNTESFAIEGASIEHELIPILTSDIGVYAPSVNQVFTLDFESKPLYTDADFSLSLNVQPVEIVYDEHSISEVTAFFQLAYGNLDMRSAAVDTLTSVATVSRAGLQHAIETHTTIHIALNMRSPYIVVPEYGTLHRGGNVLIIDLGTLIIESELQPKDVSLEDATMSEIESRLYDQFNVKISEVKVLLADSGDDWHTAQVQPNSEYHILPSVRVLFTFFNAVKPDFTQLPRHKLEAKVPSLEVNISDKRLLLLSSFLHNFPVPTSTSMATIGDDAVDGMGGPPNLPPIHLLEKPEPGRRKQRHRQDESDAQIDPDLTTLRSIRRSVLGRQVVDKRVSGRKSLTKMPTIMYTGDEPFYSASDYSDEDLDKLADMLTIKQVDDNSSVANTIVMLMRMSLGELQLNLSKEMDKEEKAYLMFRVDRLRVDSALTVHGFAAYATLGGIQLVDKIHVGHSGEYMEVLSTQAGSNSNLVSIMYRKVDPQCADFATYYGGVENAMKVKVQAMSTRFDQASMMYLNAFVQSLLSSIQGLDMKMSTSSVMTTSDVTAKDAVTFTDRIVNITDQVDGLPVNSTKLNLIAELEDFSIKLTDSDNSLAEVNVKGFEGSVIAKPAKTIVRSRLKDLSIRDCSAGAIYPNILMLQDDSLFDLKLIKYNKSQEFAQDNKSTSSGRNLGLDYSVKLRMGQVQAAVMGKFYWEITRFFEPFINQEIAEVARQTAVDTVAKQPQKVSKGRMPKIISQVGEVDTHNLRINLDVNLRTPTLMLPHDSKSTDLLLVQLGNLSIGNSFLRASSPHQNGSATTTTAAGSSQPGGSAASTQPASGVAGESSGLQEWNSIRINLSHVQVQRVCLNLVEDTTEILHTILEPLNFRADIKLALKPVISETKMDITGHLEKVKVYILQKDLQLMLGVFRYNITEGAPPPSPGIFESPTLQNIQTQAAVTAGNETMHRGELDVVDDMTAEVSTLSPGEQKTMTSLTFKLDGLSITLYSDNGKELATRTGLCLLDMEKINMAAVSHSDGDIRVNVGLNTLAVTDIRPDSDSAVKSILLCANKSESAEEQQPLVALVYKMSSDGNQKADLTVEKLCLNVYIPYMLALMQFFNGAMETVNQASSSSSPTREFYSTRSFPPRPVQPLASVQASEGVDNQTDPSSPTQSPTSSSPPTQGFTLYGRLKEPEIVLFADPRQLDSRVAVLHSDVAFEFNSDTAKQKIWAKVTDLKLLYRATVQSKTSTLVMLPCSIQLSHLTSAVTGQVEVSASLSALQLFLSPSVMQLLWDVFSVIQASSSPTKVSESESVTKPDTQNLWDIAKVSSDRWLRDIPDGDIRHSIIPTASPKETFHLEAKSLSIFFEIETLDLHVPILCLQASAEAKVEEWSKKLHIESELTLAMKFFNERVSVWEPLIEPVMEKEGLYRPWEVLIKIVRAESFPMLCVYDESDLTVPEELQTEVQQMMHRARVKSSSSETDDADGSQTSASDMTVIRHKSLRRVRQGSVHSFDSHHSSVQGESDSEPDGFISSMTARLGNIFSSNSSSDADVSDTEDEDDDENDDGIDMSLDKPVFLTSRGPVHVSAAAESEQIEPASLAATSGTVSETPPRPKPSSGEKNVKKKKKKTGSGNGVDMVDSRGRGGGVGAGAGLQEDGGGASSDRCLYVMVDSMDKMQLNVTPQAVAVLKDVVQALTDPTASELHSVRSRPRFSVNNQLGLHVYITCHNKIRVSTQKLTKASHLRKGEKNAEVRKEEMTNATIYHAGQDENIYHPADYTNDIDVIVDADNKSHCSDHSVSRMLAEAGHTLVSAGAFVFDDDDDYLSGDQIDQNRLRLQVEGFEQTKTYLHKRARQTLVPLTPIKNGMQYCVLMEVDMWHARKSISISSPLALENHLNLPVDLYCQTEDLKKFKATKHLAGTARFSKLATVEPEQTYHLPLFVAYHCPLYAKPANIGYELTYNALWWKEMLTGKDKVKSFSCLSTEEEKKSFFFKVVCKEGPPLRPPQVTSRALPYYRMSLHPPVILHNLLPYDVQFSLQGTTAATSLTHGDKTPLYTVDPHKSCKLNITLPDYMGSDWTGTLEISQDLEEFRAIAMETEVDSENLNRHLSLGIHTDQSSSMDLHIYSPYWVVNKTDLPLQLRGSLSEAVYEFGSSPSPLLFRFKKHKRKKAKLRVYESRWSQSFSTDTVGSGGVVVCHDKERGKKYMFMVQITLSKLQLTKIVTIVPFFLVINSSSQKLRYMEENEQADLWTDIDKEQFQPYWPVTESFNMYVKYDGSNVSSLHFPIKSCHSTVLRMDQGRAVCVEVTGGTNTPITIIFTDFEAGDAPARVENLCEDVFIKIHQKNQSQATLLPPYQSILYTWDEPSAERTLMWNVYGRKRASYPAFINKDGSGEIRLQVPSLRSTNSAGLVVQDTAETDDSSSPEDESDEVDGLLDHTLLSRTRVDKMVIFWVSYLDGMQRVLLFTQDERVSKAVRKAHVQSVDLPRRRRELQTTEGESAEVALFASLEGMSVSVINAAYQELALASICSSPSVWEVEVKNKWRQLDVELATWLEDQWRGEVLQASLHDQIQADLGQMQMTKPYMGALRRSFHPGIWCQYRGSKHHMALNMAVQSLQIDNQLSDAYFPTVFVRTPLPAYVIRRMGPKPFIDLGVMRRVVPEQNINTIRYAKILIQEFSLKVDKGFLLSVLDFSSHLTPPENESFQLQQDLMLARQSLKEATAVLIASRPQKIFFEYIHLSPLKLHLSFSLGGTAHLSTASGSVVPHSSTLRADIVDFFLNSVGVTLTEIKNVELKMAYFERKGVLLSTGQLLAQAQSHFTQQALQQAYVLILGLDVLGNPYGLVKDFTQGLGDFFYQPFLGSIQGRDDFSESLAWGAHSLMGNTVGSAAGSVAQITGGIGRALASISFDEDYRKKRRTRMNQEPQGLPASLAMATKTLVMGVALGLSGVILDPIKGAHEDGVEGFFKGVGKGLLGLITKPAGGIFDMVSMAFDGVRRSADMEGGAVARVRLPRFINPQLGLEPYSYHKAAGMRLLQGILKGELAKTDTYWAHAPLSREEKANVLLITDKHVLLLEKCRFWGGWDVEWKVTIDSILGVPAILDNKMTFRVKEDDSGVNLFSSGSREAESNEADILDWLQKRITSVIKYVEQSA